jgi:hypothetical protein
MFLPGGRWTVVSALGTGVLDINFWTPPGEPFPIRGTVYGGPMGGIWWTTTGFIQFITTTGHAFNGTLVYQRENYPLTAPYRIEGIVNGPDGSFPWYADTFVVG